MPLSSMPKPRWAIAAAVSTSKATIRSGYNSPCWRRTFQPMGMLPMTKVVYVGPKCRRRPAGLGSVGKLSSGCLPGGAVRGRSRPARRGVWWSWLPSNLRITRPRLHTHTVTPLGHIRRGRYLCMGQRLCQEVLDAAGDVGLVEAAHQVDAVAVGVSSMPVLVDFLAHAEGGDG